MHDGFVPGGGLLHVDDVSGGSPGRIFHALLLNISRAFCRQRRGQRLHVPVDRQYFPLRTGRPALGWISAVANYGAFYIPYVFGEQIEAAKPEQAMMRFAIFIWWFYLRRDGEFYNP